MWFARAFPVVLLALAACDSGASGDAVTTQLARPTSTSQMSVPVATEAPTTTPGKTAAPVPPTTVEPATVPTVPTPGQPPWDFTFDEFDGLVAVDAPHGVDWGYFDETVTVWSTAGGVTDGFLALRDVPAGPATSPEGDVTATRIDSPTGEAWLVIDNVPDDPAPSSATRVMWWRDDGRVWVVSNYGLTPETLTALALSIEVRSDGVPTLDDPSMTPVGTASLDSYESMTQAWTLDGHNVSLTVTNGGLAQQLGDLPVREVVERDIAGHAGYALTLSNGQVNLIWPTDHPDWWASVSGEPILADRADELAAAIIPA